MRLNRFLKQFNWRFLLVRILVNAVALAITAAVVPKIYFVDKSVWSWLLMAVMLGVLNALLKPMLQILTLQFIFVTFGLVVVLMNTVILLLLTALFPARFAVDSLLWALVGGLVLGLLSSFLESLLGLTMPLVPDEPAELRRQVEAKARRVDWNAVSDGEAEEHAQGVETVAPDSRSPGARPDAAAPGPGAIPAPAAVPEPDGEPASGDSTLAAEAPPPAEPATSADTEAADEIQNETEEARS
jgi:putative membrane protein